jgi:hypothetical protein
MEWYEIHYLFPNSFDRFIKNSFPNTGLLSISTLECFDLKKLYKFFDNEGIYLTIEMYNPSQWVFTISLSNGVVFGPTKDSKPTREETECEGFFECFKILDRRLRENL